VQQNEVDQYATLAKDLETLRAEIEGVNDEITKIDNVNQAVKGEMAGFNLSIQRLRSQLSSS